MNVVVDASLGDFVGIASTAHKETVSKSGFIGQITDVVALAMVADPRTIGSEQTTQLSGVATFDDATLLALAGCDIAWSPPAFPLESITSEGVATASAVATYTAAPFSGTYLGVVGQGIAFVVAPPLVLTLPASNVVTSGNTYRATLNGIVNPREYVTAAEFDWSPVGSDAVFSTPSVVITGTNDVPLQAQLLDLPVASAHVFYVVTRDEIGVIAAESRFFGAPPFITQQPVEPQWPVEAGTPFEFAVKATGTGQLQYQWRRYGIDMTNAAASTLVFPYAQPENSGDYSVAIANDWGAVTSRIVKLTVQAVSAAPELFLEPADQAIPADGTLTLRVEARGDPPLVFQWRKNTVNLHDGSNDDPLGRPLLTNGVVSGATTPQLVITQFQPADAGTYSVLVQNSLGIVESRPVRVRLAGVTNLPLADGNPAGSQLLIEPAGVRTASTTGFQTWGEDLRLPNITATVGWLSWRSDITGVASFTTAGSGYDTVLAVFDHLPDANSVPVGYDDDGAGYLTSYQSFSVRAGATYWLAVAGVLESQGDVVMAWNSEQTDLPPPVIISQPQSIVTQAGAKAAFSTVLTNLVEGDVLQWRRNGSDLPDSAHLIGASAIVQPGMTGALTVTLTNLNAQPEDVGVYTLLVSRETIPRVQTIPVVLEIRAGVASADITSEYKQEVLAQRVLQSLASARRSAIQRLGPGQSVSAGTIISDNFRPPGQGGTPQTLVIGGSARWYYLPVTLSGLLTVETTGSKFDSVLQVYAITSSATMMGVLQAGDDNGAPDGRNALVRFLARTNVIYVAVVDGRGGANGQVTLNWTVDPRPQGDNFRWFVLDTSAVTPPGYAVVDTSAATQIGKVHLVYFGSDYPYLQAVRTFSNATAEAPPTRVYFPIATRLPYLLLAEPVTGVPPGAMQFSWTFQQAPPPEVSLKDDQVRIRWLRGGLKLQSAGRVYGPWFDVTQPATPEGSENEIRFHPTGTMRLFRIFPDLTP